MKLKTQNGTSLIVTDNDYIGGGGEGSVYAHASKAIKVYAGSFDPSKFKELMVLQHPRILAPEEIIYSGTKPVGYSMPLVTNLIPLCRTFITGFQKRNNPDLVSIYNSMREGFQYIHSKGILIVDANEFNFLTDLRDTYFIDVDSYQTPNYPAKVIMPTVRDWHTTPLSTLSDWFSFAVTTFNMWTGLHPYKGTHPLSLEERMRQNISVYHKDVKVPNQMRPLTSIPNSLQDWYEDEFTKGIRTAAPEARWTKPVTQVITKLAPTSAIKLTELASFSSDILGIAPWGSGYVIYLDRKMVVNGIEKSCAHTTGFSEGKTYDIVDREVVINSNPSGVFADKLLYYANTVFVVKNDSISELITEPVITTRLASKILPNSYTMYRGCIHSEVLGACYFYLPQTKGILATRIKDLDRYRIIDAKWEKGWLVTSVYNGDYFQYVWHRGSGTFTPGQSNVNFAALDNGVAAIVEPNGTLVITNGPKSTRISNSNLGTLYSLNSTICMTDGTKLFKLSTS